MLAFGAAFFITGAEAVQVPSCQTTIDVTGSYWDPVYESIAETDSRVWFQEAVSCFSPPTFFPEALTDEIVKSFGAIPTTPFLRFSDWLGSADYFATWPRHPSPHIVKPHIPAT